MTRCAELLRTIDVDFVDVNVRFVLLEIYSESFPCQVTMSRPLIANRVR